MKPLPPHGGKTRQGNKSRTGGPGSDTGTIPPGKRPYGRYRHHNSSPQEWMDQCGYSSPAMHIPKGVEYSCKEEHRPKKHQKVEKTVLRTPFMTPPAPPRRQNGSTGNQQMVGDNVMYEEPRQGVAVGDNPHRRKMQEIQHRSHQGSGHCGETYQTVEALRGVRRRGTPGSRGIFLQSPCTGNRHTSHPGLRIRNHPQNGRQQQRRTRKGRGKENKEQHNRRYGTPLLQRRQATATLLHRAVTGTEP